MITYYELVVHSLKHYGPMAGETGGGGDREEPSLRGPHHFHFLVVTRGGTNI